MLAWKSFLSAAIFSGISLLRMNIFLRGLLLPLLTLAVTVAEPLGGSEAVDSMMAALVNVFGPPPL